MLKNWLKTAYKNYIKNWMTTGINLLGLSLGLTVFLLVFLNWQDEKSYEKWVPDADNTYYVLLQTGKNDYANAISYPLLHVSKKSFKEIKEYSIVNIWDDFKVRFNYEGHSIYDTPMLVSPGFFTVFNYPKVAGSYDNIFVDDNSVALSEDAAKQLFGKDYLNSIGKTISKDDDGQKMVVQAIYKLPADSENTVFRSSMAYRMMGLPKDDGVWTNYTYAGYLKLDPKADVAKVEDEMAKMVTNAENKENAKNGWDPRKDDLKVHLVPIKDMKLESKGTSRHSGDKKSLMILLSLAALIMILSGINFINLNTAQASQRAKEVGLRKVFGVSKMGIVLQFLLEAFVIYFTAFVISVVLIELLLPYYNKFLGKQIQVEGFHLYFYTILIAAAFAFISGIIPALYLSNFKPIETLKGNFARSKHGIWLRNSILTLQLIISSFFIISSFVIYQQVNYMMNKNLGFQGDQVYQINFNKANHTDLNYNGRKYEFQKAKLKHFPGVIDVTGSIQSIGKGLNNYSGAKYKKDSAKSTGAGIGAIDLNFFKFYGLKIVAGRDFDPKLTTDTVRSIVVNETFVKNLGWNNQEAIGKEISSGVDTKANNLQIIGVVKNFYIGDVKYEVPSIMFFNYERYWTKGNMTNVQIKLSPENMTENLARIKKYWETEVEPGYPFSGEFVNKTFAQTFESYQKQRTLFSVLNGIVLLVALLGLFALSSLMIEQKLKDVAIKKTLGASDAVVVKDLTKKFLWITIIAVAISMPIGYYFMNEWLKDFAYRIEMPWWPYVLSLVILILLTFAVVSFKAYRATKVSLIKYLKYE